MYDVKNTNRFFSVRGVSQSDRINAALLPDYFKIEDRNINDLVSFLIKYSELLTYFNEQNNYDGNWESFFKNDPTISLISLAGIETQKLQMFFKQHYGIATNSNHSNTTHNHVFSILDELYKVLHKIDDSLLILKQYPDFSIDIESSVKYRLGPLLNKLLQLESAVSGKAPRINATLEFSPIWFQKEVKKLSLNQPVKALESFFYEFVESIESLKKGANNFLNEEVLTNGNVNPHISIFIAFAELYKLAGEKLNGLTERHLDYYYQEILKLGLRPPKPDYAHLLLTTNEPNQLIELPKGSLFTAGVQDENELLYQSEKDTLITGGKISEAIGIDFGSPEAYYRFNPSERNIIRPYIFNPTVKLQEPFQLGFAIRSPYLKHPEGERKITLTFELSSISFYKLIDLINSRNYSDEDPLTWVNEYFRNKFVTSYSNENEMQSLSPEYTEVIIIEDNENDDVKYLEIRSLVRKTLPAIQAQEGEHPLLSITFKEPDVQMYEWLKLLEFESVNLDVEVLEVKDLIVQNDLGVLDPNLPFQPFGPLPKMGTEFLIGHRSLFLFPVKDLRVNIEWDGLPNFKQGFKEHYNGYSFIEGNDSFKAKISAFKDKTWYPEEDKQVVSLFQTMENDDDEISPVSTVRRFNELDIPVLKLDAPSDPTKSVDLFDVHSSDGFVKFELCWPPNAFGHEEYPDLMTKSAIENSAKSKRTVPNEPYTPVIRNLSIDYKVSIKFEDSNQNFQFFHIYPFGKETVKYKHSDLTALIPSFNAGSSLFLGIEGVENVNTISLFFQLKSAFRHPDFDLKWSELVNGEWKTIGDQKIIHDETDMFTNSGIVQLELTESKTVDGKLKTVWNKDYRWIKVECNDQNFFNGLLEYVACNGVKVSCVNPADRKNAELPPESISSLKNKISGIASVYQPFPSFDGLSGEGINEFRTRVSERLKHKDRAWNNWDITRLILSRFPDIHIVKCLNHTNEQLKTDPGSVLITVVPKPKLSKKGNFSTHFFSKSYLERVRAFVLKRSPERLNVNVVNPLYEKVRLKFNVKFLPGYDENFYLGELKKSVSVFLNPWQESGGDEVAFGESVNSSNMLNFIESLHYVDYVLNFSAFHIINDRIANLNNAKNHNTEINPSTPISILTSDNVHDIFISTEDKITDKKGIAEMMVGTDFLIEDLSADSGEGISHESIGKNFRIRQDLLASQEENIIFTFSIPKK